MGQEAEALEEVVVKARKDNESDTEHDVVHVLRLIVTTRLYGRTINVHTLAL